MAILSLTLDLHGSGTNRRPLLHGRHVEAAHAYGRLRPWHGLVILSLTQTAIEPGLERTSRLFLADLGGSEKLTKSQAADDFKSLVVTSGGEEVRLVLRLLFSLQRPSFSR